MVVAVVVVTMVLVLFFASFFFVPTFHFQCDVLASALLCFAPGFL